MYLKTERLVIRSIKTTDIDDVFEIYQDDVYGNIKVHKIAAEKYIA